MRNTLLVWNNVAKWELLARSLMRHVLVTNGWRTLLIRILIWCGDKVAAALIRIPNSVSKEVGACSDIINIYGLVWSDDGSHERRMPDELQSPISSSPSQHLPSLSAHDLPSLSDELATFQAKCTQSLSCRRSFLRKTLSESSFPFI